MKQATHSAESFVRRHIGPRPDEAEQMLATIGVASLDRLMEETVPAGIRLDRDLDISEGMSEQELLSHLSALAGRNRVLRSYIGLGYYGTFTPPVILRNVLENPGWYTAYTPYQAEISQGRLEALINFQTMVSDLTGLPFANASLLDEATAAGEAMTMFFRSPGTDRSDASVFLVDEHVFPQTLAVLQTRAEPLGIRLRVGAVTQEALAADVFGVLIQYPGAAGDVPDCSAFIAAARTAGVRVAVAADLMGLVLLRSPGELGADVALGSTQRFGVPLGFGGPHAAYFATTDELKRNMPGRIIGVSIDAQGNPAYRMSLQTREQHIRREKATSNICTAQALLAVMAGMYAVYHGPEGLRAIALSIHARTGWLSRSLKALGYEQVNEHFFDTVTVRAAGRMDELRRETVARGFNVRYNSGDTVSISFDETVTEQDVASVVDAFAAAAGKQAAGPEHPADSSVRGFPPELARTEPLLTHPIWSAHHSETQMMRYLKRLENRDLALNRAMIPLGSCTMKLNAAAQMLPVTWAGFGAIHPFAPADQTEGYGELIRSLERDLCEITGFAGASLQPNSGAQGEYAGLMVIRAYHESRGDSNRRVVLIPSSAHGTNPASAVLAGMQVVVVSCDAAGNIDVADLRDKASRHAGELAALMATYPSTHGVFEEGIQSICEVIHQAGGQVYMDGANMNAQVGYTNPARIGADVCHLNLHKTFAIPHGGGGPGMGPICVAAHLVSFLPGHPMRSAADGGGSHMGAVSAAPYGSAGILVISYAYIKLLGRAGLRDATRCAVLNANYIKARLEQAYEVLYTGRAGRVAHEMIIDLRGFKKCGIEAEDVAKRLMDYGFHAPTMSFPIAGTLMIEPTESEPLEELDRFCAAMLAIRKEIADVDDGGQPVSDSPLKHAPHTMGVVTADIWDRAYSRRLAAFPGGTVADKYWPPVGRIDNVFGDRHLICTCPPIDSFREAADPAAMVS